MQITRIVVLEPDLFHRDLMTDLIESNDLVCVSGEDSEDFSAVAAGESPESVVVVDLDDEQHRGLETVRKLRTLPPQRQPRVVGLAGQDTRDLLLEEGDLFIEEIVDLPMDTGEFVRAVSRQSREAQIGAD